MPKLKELIDRDTGGKPGSALIMVPNNRSLRYFLELYRKDGKATILPASLDYSAVINLWASPRAGQMILANQLDLVCLAWEAVNEAAKTDERLACRFAKMELGDFLPWGFRLARLFERLFSDGLPPRDIAYAENDVAQPAAQLLSSLGQIGRHWQTGLQAHNWTTPGYNAWLASRYADEIPEYLTPAKERHIYIAGFYELDGVQNKLFRNLWQKGATICLHTHPHLMDSQSAEAAICAAHRKWLKRWGAVVEYPDASEPSVPETGIDFFAGYDLHSQLLEMQKIMSENEPGSTAIVLTDPDALTPILHHIPQKEVNISLGYSLERTLLMNFLEELFNLAKNRSSDGSFYWKDLLKLARQPFLRILKVSRDGSDLAEILGRMEKCLRGGTKYISWSRLYGALKNLDESGLDALQKIYSCCVENIINAQTSKELGQALQSIADFLLAFSPDTWEKFPLEAEALNRLQTSIIPLLLNNALANEKFTFETLESIFQDLRQERIPFEADPLVGIQVLGLLETRLLQFDNVIFIDANEDLLPGGISSDPLLPDSLAGLLGLPDRRSRDANVAYNFFRLCAGAKHVHLLWQEGVSRSTLFDSKKMPSRFVERFLWREEKRQKKLLKRGDGKLRMAQASLGLRHVRKNELQRTPGLDNKLEKRLALGVSSTFIDNFYSCPLAFARSRLLGLAPLPQVLEGDDPPMVGSLVHRTLCEFYKPMLGKDITKERNEDPDFLQSLLKIYEDQLKYEGIAAKLPLDSCLMLEEAGYIRFKKYLHEQPDLTKITRLESRFDLSLKIQDRPLKFTGIIDRIDERDGRLVALDYKTGSLKDMKTELWQDTGFFEELRDFCQSGHADWERGEELFLKLRDSLPSVQLPFYVQALCKKNQDIASAAYVDLYDTGKEKHIFGKELNGTESVSIPERCAILIEFVLKHLLEAPTFKGNGENCERCDFTGICSAGQV